jgi:glycosyltransferase involved in cell wall biosynthesis
MKVSVLLAVYNGAAFIAEAIESVLKQSHPDWELIVVSNGSTDDTMRICREASRRDARVQCFELTERNKNAAYNCAFSKASGDYICYFASDDVLPPTSLERRLAAVAGKGPAALSTCCLQTVSNDPKFDGIVFPKNRKHPNYAGGSMMFSRELATRVFPLPVEQPNEDTWTLLHLQAFGETHHVPEPLYYYRIHSLNSYGYGLTFDQKRDRYLHRMHAYKLFADKYGDAQLPLIQRHVLPFLKGLQAARDRNVFRILRVRGLDIGSKLVLTFYCSKLLYNIRHTFFRTLSGGVAK